jgi:hypothetical protein
MYEGCSKRMKKKVMCSKKIYLIAPNGVRFRCVSYMLRNKCPLEDAKKGKLSNPMVSEVCEDYGFCAPCDLMGDIKIKNI